MNTLPKVGDIITVIVEPGNHIMIGKILTQTNSFSEPDSVRGDAIYITYNFVDNTIILPPYAELQRDWWCYKSSNRNWTLASSWERKWFNLCVKANKYVDPPSKFYSVSDFIKRK